MAFVLVQPTVQQANAVGVEELPGYDDCIPQSEAFVQLHEDPISMNTVRSGSIVKTIHAEKEIVTCFLDQGDLPVAVDVTTYIEIYENIDDREVIETNAVATTCLKEPAGEDSGGATVIDCESYEIPSTPVSVGSNCIEIPPAANIRHPQEMNTVTKGKIAKTIESQEEVFVCVFGEVCILQNGPCTLKKVDIILFTEIFEDLATQEVEEVQFHAMRCVVLLTDASDDRRDATVETCQFSSIEN